jgi:murein DD-endopeptidase MepM/ murein hydrolase activator NlpD
VPANVGPWSTVGGSPVTVGPGETVAALSSRYGVPQDTLLKVNGLTSASQVTSGSRLVIPVYNASAPVQAASVKTVAAPVAAMKAQAATRAVGATTAPTQSVATKAAAAQTTVKAAAPVAVDPKIALREKAAAEKAALAAKKIEGAKIAKAKATEDASAAARRTKVAAETTASMPADAKPEFRWPARGRIIQGFRSGANDGINIALPEGTSVKAAEAGVVAYAGSELKGYGNLVLIRHPNGYVSAYAHNGAVAVKRGETVKRGQTIAKSGQSGNVASPQLHFELRKGSTPVDPTGYLAGL